MPLIQEHTDSLPYIDRPVTPSSLANAESLIASERASVSSSSQQQIHPLLPPAPSPSFSPLIQSELERVSAAEKTPLSAIDLSRYEASSSSEQDEEKDVTAASSHLRAAYTNAAYLSKRLEALELLDAFGKNAWLVGNSRLEDILARLERELVLTRESGEAVNRARKQTQLENGKGELEGGERAWREGVRGVLEAEIAVQGLGERIRGALREQVGGR